MSVVSRLDPGGLEALDADDWAWLLPHVRRVVTDARDDLGAEDASLADLPAGRLAGGEPRRRVCTLISGDPRLLTPLARVVRETVDVPPAVRALLSAPSDVGRTSPDPMPQETARSRDRARLRRVRDQLDEARRQVEGERARAVGFEERVQFVTAERDEARVELASALAQLDVAGREREQAVERERRRREQEIARLTDEVRRLRRLQADARRLTDETRQHPPESVRRSAAATTEGPDGVHPERVIPGRPTALPDGVAPLSREAAELLMNRDRLVVIDGYNVTLQHQTGLGLEHQRRWLVDLATRAVQRFGVRPLIVFDGEVAGSGDAGALRRGVRVRFTDAGFTADDDIVLEVDATDEPVLVVTDDEELARRVRASDADVLATAPFVWATR
ncbi:MAG: NYN domain-containing protein [Nitriliruptoraceae bacterium]